MAVFDVRSWRALCGALLLLHPAAAAADQDEVPVVLPEPAALFAQGEAGDWLPAAAGRVDIAGYPIGDEHTWHGRLGADVALVRIDDALLYRMGLAMQTVADHRNDIAFRLVRLYYDATQLIEWRLGDGVAYVGLRHRCTHGADAVTTGGEEGRILIRSGPELGYGLARQLGALRVIGRVFAHGTMIGQNDDPEFKPRALFAGALSAGVSSGSLRMFGSVGLGGALVSAGSARTFGFGSPWRDLRVEALPAAALGFAAQGRVAEFSAVLHYQRMMDSGFGQTADSASLLSGELGFRW